MSDSFFFRPTPFVSSPDALHRVLVTGAAGQIGTEFVRRSHDRYRLVLMVQPGTDTTDIRDCGEIVEVDLGDLAG